jgi:hypothetical protein
VEGKEKKQQQKLRDVVPSRDVIVKVGGLGEECMSGRDGFVGENGQ